MENAQIVASIVENRGAGNCCEGWGRSGRGGERVRLDPPVPSADSFLLMILFQGEGYQA